MKVVRMYAIDPTHPKKCVCTAGPPRGWSVRMVGEKGGWDACIGAQKCVSVKILFHKKKIKKKCSDSWQRTGGV